jgi:Domain of unknown function (DUF1830)
VAFKKMYLYTNKSDHLQVIRTEGSEAMFERVLWPNQEVMFPYDRQGILNIYTSEYPSCVHHARISFERLIVVRSDSWRSNWIVRAFDWTIALVSSIRSNLSDTA